MGEALVKRVKEGIVDHGNHTNSIILIERERKLGVRKLSEMFSLEKTHNKWNKVCVFKRSIQKLKLRYTSLLGDGDTKSIEEINLK